MLASEKRLSMTCIITADDSLNAADFLAAKSGLSKSKIKDAMVKGAVRLTPTRGKNLRLRKATARLKPGDTLTLAYDEALLAITPPQASLIKDLRHYSVWSKPAGLLAQGTEFGDHCSILRQAETFFQQTRRPVFLVHRLDREVAGLMLIAHSKKAASRLSALFQQGSIEKIYQAEVLGSPANETGIITDTLDGKPAQTEYRLLSSNPETNTSILQVAIHTGRLHQIRRHLEMIGHPIMGDPRYGQNNKDPRGMQLSAVSLRFVCPFAKREVSFSLFP